MKYSMKKLTRFSLVLSMSLLSACQSNNLLGLDDSSITVLATSKNTAEVRTKLTQVMQSAGYKIDKSNGQVLEFRRGIKGVLAVLSAGERLQQEDVVNCVLSDQGVDTLISCRTHLESVNRKGIEKRTEKTQALGYRKKLVAELSAVNR